MVGVCLISLSPASSIQIVVRPAACNASEEEEDKTVEEWETRMTRIEDWGLGSGEWGVQGRVIQT